MNEEREIETVVENPTYLEHIRKFFLPGDVRCMARFQINLATYEGVKFNAQRIYFHVREGSMPPPSQNRRWSEARVETFYKWMRNGYPRGTAEPAVLPATASGAARVRRNIAGYAAGSDELETLKRAFRGLMDRDRNPDPEPDKRPSYFTLAGRHWLPGPQVYCRHHENAYNPWHRAYLIAFENALRTVEGCENVTLPYWDIRALEVPAVLFEAPFDKYSFPADLVALDGEVIYRANDDTVRNTAAEIIAEIDQRGIAPTIDNALKSDSWERFNGWSRTHADPPNTPERIPHSGIILAHDHGHVACGETMSSQNGTAFDPIFWFFHANWDRLWWRWQQAYCGTTLDGFKTLLEGDAYWLDDPVVNRLDPFDETSANMVDLTAHNVDYEHPDYEELPKPAQPETGSVAAVAGFSLAAADKVSVRVKGVDRLEIPGSFDICLWLDDEIIEKAAVFQSTTPRQCSTCRENAIVNVDFLVDRTKLERGRLRASIEVYSRGNKKGSFPLSQAGDPTINVRSLLVA